MKSSLIVWIKAIIHIAALTFIGLIFWDFLNDQLTANPIEEITKRTGKYTLISLVLTLSCTPAGILFDFNDIIKARRQIGLYSFFFATLHFFTFLGLDYAFDVDLVLKDVIKKRYVVAGFSTYLILALLAATSLNFARRELGRQWSNLHALIYLAGSLAVLHFAWLVKAGILEPLLYGSLILLLLVLRLSLIKNKSFFSQRRKVAEE
ncbi:MAG: protein-methionine-sulfoxide reductase heme-binding subunit MsrQ [Candidatus Pacebacteria bacterium]|nr:protein-methionine-sulfoxide reductase heme-binding subunit MsrQ [Candidatus Paceibacterota bacterium]